MPKRPILGWPFPGPHTYILPISCAVDQNDFSEPILEFLFTKVDKWQIRSLQSQECRQIPCLYIAKIFPHFVLYLSIKKYIYRNLEVKLQTKPTWWQGGTLHTCKRSDRWENNNNGRELIEPCVERDLIWNLGNIIAVSTTWQNLVDGIKQYFEERYLQYTYLKRKIRNQRAACSRS